MRWHPSTSVNSGRECERRTTSPLNLHEIGRKGNTFNRSMNESNEKKWNRIWFEFPYKSLFSRGSVLCVCNKLWPLKHSNTRANILVSVIQVRKIQYTMWCWAELRAIRCAAAMNEWLNARATADKSISSSSPFLSCIFIVACLYQFYYYTSNQLRWQSEWYATRSNKSPHNIFTTKEVAAKEKLKIVARGGESRHRLGKWYGSRTHEATMMRMFNVHCTPFIGMLDAAPDTFDFIEVAMQTDHELWFILRIFFFKNSMRGMSPPNLLGTSRISRRIGMCDI